MKLIGLVGIVLTSLCIGWQKVIDCKQQIAICDSLIGLCNELSADLSYRQTPIIDVVTGYLRNTRIDFIDEECFYHKEKVNSILSSTENERISQFIYSLGKSDISSQNKLIESFKLYMEESKDRYKSKYSSKSRVYLAFGLCGGLTVSLLLI